MSWLKYNKFDPWGSGSNIVKGPIEFKNNDNVKHIKIDAELAIGFNFVSVGTDQNSLSTASKLDVSKLKNLVNKNKSKTY